MIFPVSDSFILCGPTRFISLPSHLVMELDFQGITDWRLNVSEPLSNASAFLGNVHFLHKPSSVVCHVLAKPLARLPLSFQLYLSLPILRIWAKCSQTFHILFLRLFHAISLPKIFFSLYLLGCYLSLKVQAQNNHILLKGTALSY